MAAMATEKQREHIRNYEASRRERGWQKATVWLSPEAVAALPALVKEHGSRDAAINARLVGEPPAPAENPAPPASVTRAKKTPAEPKTPVKRPRVAAPSKKAASEPESRVAAGAPYVKDVVRKPYQKGQTKGSKR